MLNSLRLNKAWILLQDLRHRSKSRALIDQKENLASCVCIWRDTFPSPTYSRYQCLQVVPFLRSLVRWRTHLNPNRLIRYLISLLIGTIPSMYHTCYTGCQPTCNPRYSHCPFGSGLHIHRFIRYIFNIIMTCRCPIFMLLWDAASLSPVFPGRFSKISVSSVKKVIDLYRYHKWSVVSRNIHIRARKWINLPNNNLLHYLFQTHPINGNHLQIYPLSN